MISVFTGYLQDLRPRRAWSQRKKQPKENLPKERQNLESLSQAQKLLGKALLPVDKNLENKEYLIGEFSGADIMLGHSLYMSNKLGCVSNEMTNIRAYIERNRQY